MMVCELISKLQVLPQEAIVTVSMDDGNGCDSCGFGRTYSEHEIVKLHDLETRVVLEHE